MTNPTTTAKPTRAAVDWERIEADYRAGVLTLREIASQHTISHVAISKRAKKEGWPRDLKARIQSRADELVSKRGVNGQLTEQAKATERETIESNARAIADVKLGQRDGWAKTRHVVATLKDELLATCDADLPAWLERIASERMDEKAAAEFLGQVQNLVALPTRIAGAHKLVDMESKLTLMECKIWGIEDGQDGGSQPGVGRDLSDVERATRLSGLLSALRQRKAAAAEDASE